MNKSFKAVFLVIILGIPALIFVFLKMFGVNQFDLPVYYENGVDTAFTDCEFKKGQHVIPDFSFPGFSSQQVSNDYLDGAFLVVYFSQDFKDEISHRVNMGLARVQGSLETADPVRIVSIQPKTAGKQDVPINELADKYGAAESTWFIDYAKPDYTNRLARCGFVIDFDTTGANINKMIVLADKEGRIRGYFNGLDGEEIERLIVELKILKRNLE